MKNSDRAIGLVDSGVGGLTVAHEIFRLLPEERIIYYADTLHLPYGTKDLNLIKNYVEKIVRYLIKKKRVKAVVIACNTATSAALEDLKQIFDIPIVGVIEPAVARTAALKRGKKIAVIATEATIKSNTYQKKLLNIDNKIKLYLKACPKFVEFVEKGKFKGELVEKKAAEYLASIAAAEPDSLILGCTHFPYLRPVIEALVAKNVNLIDPAQETAVEIKKILCKLDLLNKNKDSDDEFIASDKRKISKTFLKEGSKFLELENLNFKEENIFNS